MKCIRCGRETAEGDIYKFYYGKTGETDFPNHRTTRTRYAIAASENAYICDQCVGQHIERRARLMAGGVFVGILILSILRLVIGGPAPKGSELETVIGFPMAFVGGLVLYIGIRRWKKGKQRKFMGDSLAIKTRKTALTQSGYNAFFTRDDYLRLS
jgi:hypothetical protein